MLPSKAMFSKSNRTTHEKKLVMLTDDQLVTIKQIHGQPSDKKICLLHANSQQSILQQNAKLRTVNQLDLH